jgi:CubicO group peptidase (beta-lactamase class C family)
MIASKLPAVSFALLRDGEVVGCKALGFRDIDRRLPATPATLFGIGSITKVFTALAIMQLQDRRVLHVDDPVSRYVDFHVEPRGELIRIRHFLSHTSGIPALGFSESKMSERWFMTGYPISDEEDLLTFMQGAEDWAHSPPGERWFYLNEGYVLLGSIIEEVSGQHYADYVREHILLPLGMTRSYFDRGQVEGETDVATPYMLDREGRHFVGSNLYGQMPAAGGLVSNTEDMARFAGMFLRHGKSADGMQIISRDGLAAMMETRVQLPQDADETLAGDSEIVSGAVTFHPTYSGHYGYGLQIYRDFLGHHVIGHGGGVMGGTSYLAVIPERQVGVVLLANGHGYPMGQLAMYALSALVGHDPQELPFVRRHHLIERLQGRYESFRGTIQAEVASRGELLELKIKFQHEDRIVPLIPLQLDEREPRFYTLSSGRQLPVEFRCSAETVDLVYERYKFRKV